MHNSFLNIVKILKSDEELNRLLYYPPENLGEGILDPLDATLENIMDMDIEKRSEIIKNRIVKSAKFTDLENQQICRLYVYAGVRRSGNNNYLSANQEITIDILCHSDIENDDLRSLRISDRLNQMFCRSRVDGGIGEVDFVVARPINAPYEYVGYQVVFSFSTFKK